MLWAFEEREKLMEFYERVSGARMHAAYWVNYSDLFRFLKTWRGNIENGITSKGKPDNMSNIQIMKYLRKLIMFKSGVLKGMRLWISPFPQF